MYVAAILSPLPRSDLYTITTQTTSSSEHITLIQHTHPTFLLLWRTTDFGPLKPPTTSYVGGHCLLIPTPSPRRLRRTLTHTCTRYLGEDVPNMHLAVDIRGLRKEICLAARGGRNLAGARVLLPPNANKVNGGRMDHERGLFLHLESR